MSFMSDDEMTEEFNIETLVELIVPNDVPNDLSTTFLMGRKSFHEDIGTNDEEKDYDAEIDRITLVLRSNFNNKKRDIINFTKCFIITCNYKLRTYNRTLDTEYYYKMYINASDKICKSDNNQKVEVNQCVFQNYIDFLMAYNYSNTHKCLSTNNDKYYVHCKSIFHDLEKNLNTNNFTPSSQFCKTLCEKYADKSSFFCDNVHVLINKDSILPIEIIVLRYFLERETIDNIYSFVKKRMIASAKKM